jgi:outer membrane protein TolC
VLLAITPAVSSVAAQQQAPARPATAQAPPQPTLQAPPQPVPAAQGQPAQAPGQPAAQAAGQPPSFLFPPEGITLEDAVRLTLEHDPAILHARATVQQREGIAIEQKGLFDFVLNGNGSYTHRVQQLTESRYQTEVDKRTALRNAVTQSQAGVQQAQTLIQALNNVKSALPGAPQVQALAQISPTIAGTVQVIDQIINSTSDANLRSSLIDTRNQFLTNTINQTQAGLDSGLVDFNQLQQDVTNLGDAPIDEVFIDGSIGFSLTKLTRSGISFTPSMDGAFSGTNYKDKPSSADFGGKGVPDLYTLHAGVSIGVPLLRGRGPAAVAAAEHAALLAHDASALELQHQMSQSVLVTVLAYWDLRAAQENLDIGTQAVTYQQQLLQLSQGLIAAGELPQAELSRAQASLARAQASTEDARKTLHQARVSLATAIGVAATADDATLPRAHDAFPQAPDASSLPGQAGDLIAQGLAQRRDLGAAVTTESADQALVEGAKRNLPPRLDLSAATFYTAIDSGNFKAAADRWAGPSANVGLQFEKPLGNNTLRGQYLQRQAEAEQDRISAVELDRQIRLNILQSTGTFQDAVTRLQQAQAAVGYYQTMIDAETQRFRIGEATLIDTVTTQEQQIDAMLTLVAARQDLAARIAQLRFQTGTLVIDGNVRTQDLLTLPPRRVQ